MKYSAILASALLALAACGSSQPSTASAAAEPAGGGADTDTTGGDGAAVAATGTAAGFDVSWTELKYDQKKQVMKKAVMPRMAELFAQFDSGQFGDADCTLCHGEAAMSGDFEMPNPKLPALAFGSPEWPEYESTHAEIMGFMKEQVVPEMSTLLGLAPYTPENPTGFGCFSCHPQPDAM